MPQEVRKYEINIDVLWPIFFAILFAVGTYACDRNEQRDHEMKLKRMDLGIEVAK